MFNLFLCLCSCLFQSSWHCDHLDWGKVTRSICLSCTCLFIILCVLLSVFYLLHVLLVSCVALPGVVLLQSILRILFPTER